MNWIRKDPLSKLDIKYKLPLGFITLYLVVFGIGGYLVIRSVYSPLSNEILLRLESESLAQATLFDKKFDMLARRSEDFASDGFIRTHTDELVSLAAGRSNQSGSSTRSKEEVRNLLQTHLRVNKLPLVQEFVELQVYDLQGTLIASVRDSIFAIQHTVAAKLPSDEQRFSPLILPTDDIAYPTTAVISPLWHIRQKRKVGYLVCIINLISVIKQTTLEYERGISESNIEKYLTFVDHTGVSLELPWRYLEDVRTAEDGMTEYDMMGVKIIPARLSASPILHHGRHACQNGKAMYGQSYPLRSIGWEALVEINAEQAMAPLTELEGRLLGIALAVALTTLILLFFPVQYLVRPLGELQRMAVKIKEGVFSVRSEIHSEDEIGQLAKTFNLMTEAIEERTRHLEQTATNLQHRERELRIQHNRLKTVVESMTDGLILLNDAGEIVLSNQASTPIMKMLNQVNQRLGVRKCDIHAPASQHCLHCLIDTSTTTSCVLMVDEKIFEVISTQLPSLNGGASGKILVARDITERELMNERQAHQERLMILGKTAAVVAHELNNPLAAISMYNQMLDTELPKDSPFHEHVEVIKRNTETCRRIIDELLDYARTPQARVETIDLHQLLEDVIRFLRPLHKKKTFTIEKQFHARNATIWGDATQLRQVFVNLLDNAIQAVDPKTGVIVLTTAEYHVGQSLSVDVIDNGAGIAQAQPDEIFEPFFTTRSSGGTGLGLPTAKRIVEAHRGTLTLLRSQPGETVFRVVLPRAGVGPSSGRSSEHVEERTT